ncbi:lyase family protein [Conexibacter sp. SYSU D00693]|uniref:class II fumarate hydratase n=1 Tax=Conexibacter sp. SYSU D00693 TaxID=2812560 RepID=UPI00196B076B|nr:class II fumarate hydratase [Conexibacter sp. SYSU D00693]
MPPKKLYGGETTKAVENFPISGETVPPSVIHWLGRIKGAAARVNGELGLLDKDLAAKIADAADAVARGDHDEQFPIDVFQTGSGTSSNMNTNEVIASLSGAHPNDDVNYGQSSNDVFPSAVHLAALDEATNTLLPALKQLEKSLERKARAFKDVVKSGRTHLMDAVPVTLGQEFAGYATQIRLGQERVQAALTHVGQIPLGGTATGTGLNTHPKFAERVRKQLAKESRLKLIAPPADPFEAQANRDALVELSGALKVVAVSLTKIAQDLALMGSGPRAGIGELFLPELQKGSSIMPGKVNPVIPEVVLQVSAQVIGNDTAITIGGMQGQFELNVRIPLIARNLLQSIHLLSTTSVAFAEKCIDGVQANKEGTKRSAESTLATATALNTSIGYDKAAAIVKEAATSGRMLRDVALEQGVDPKVYDETIDLRRIAAGNQAEPKPAARPAAAAAGKPAAAAKKPAAKKPAAAKKPGARKAPAKA